MPERVQCPECGGTGCVSGGDRFDDHDPCPSCSGEGVVEPPAFGSVKALTAAIDTIEEWFESGNGPGTISDPLYAAFTHLFDWSESYLAAARPVEPDGHCIHCGLVPRDGFNCPERSRQSCEVKPVTARPVEGGEPRSVTAPFGSKCAKLGLSCQLPSVLLQRVAVAPEGEAGLDPARYPEYTDRPAGPLHAPSLPVREACERCFGSGMIHCHRVGRELPEPCPKCKGTGIPPSLPVREAEDEGPITDLEITDLDDPPGEAEVVVYEDEEVKLSLALHVYRFYSPQMARRLAKRLVAVADEIDPPVPVPETKDEQ